MHSLATPSAHLPDYLPLPRFNDGSCSEKIIQVDSLVHCSMFHSCTDQFKGYGKILLSRLFSSDYCESCFPQCTRFAMNRKVQADLIHIRMTLEVQHQFKLSSAYAGIAQLLHHQTEFSHCLHRFEATESYVLN